MEGNELNIFAAAMRKAETGQYEEKHRQTSYVGWDDRRATRLVGSYAIPETDWPAIAAHAGLPGARWQDPAAQDRVVKGVFADLFEQYQDWRLVAVAWKAGQEVADQVQADPTALSREPTGALAKFTDTVMNEAKTYQGPALPVPNEGQPEVVNPFTQMVPEAANSTIGASSVKPGDMVRSILFTMRDNQRNKAAAAPEVATEETVSDKADIPVETEVPA